MQKCYTNHRHLENSDYLNSGQRGDFEKCFHNKLDVNSSKDLALLQASLINLIEYLYQYHNQVQDLQEAQARPISEQQGVILLIDEYDAPILAAYENKYYDNMIEFMREFVGSAIKDNPYLFKGVLTGILRVSQASLFSGANNIKAYSVLSNTYSRHFGFTLEEVKALLKQAQYDSYFNQVQAWYNGYQFGDLTICNPWSIVNYLSDIVSKNKKPEFFDSYWVNTSSNIMIKTALMNAPIDVKQKFVNLLQNHAVECIIDEHSVFDDIQKETPALWGLLVFSGYLTVVRRLLTTNSSNLFSCELKLPNQEVMGLFDQLTQQSLKTVCEGDNGYQEFIKSLIEGDVKLFTHVIKRYLKESASYYEFNKNSDEVVYHAFVLGMVVGLRDRYTILSNRESGDGRYDVAFYPKVKTNTSRGIILEFKATSNRGELQQEANNALQQIQRRQYHTEMQSIEHIKQVLMMGIAFCGKEVTIVSKLITLSQKEGISTSLTPLLFDYVQKMQSESSSSISVTHTSQEDSKRKFTEEQAIRKKAKLSDNEMIEFDIHRTKGDGNCGFYALPIPNDRQGACDLLLAQQNDRHIRELVAPEIRAIIIEGNELEIFPTHQYYMQWREQYINLQTEIDDTVRKANNFIQDNPNKPKIGNLNNLIAFFKDPRNLTVLTTNSYKKFQTDLEQLLIKLEQHEKDLDTKLVRATSYFTDFIKYYVGGKGLLSFARDKDIPQTSSLDAIAEIQQWRVHIWQADDQEEELKLVYSCGPEGGQPQHLYHWGGLDSHFELMSSANTHTINSQPSSPGFS